MSCSQDATKYSIGNLVVAEESVGNNFDAPIITIDDFNVTSDSFACPDPFKQDYDHSKFYKEHIPEKRCEELKLDQYLGADEEETYKNMMNHRIHIDETFQARYIRCPFEYKADIDAWKFLGQLYLFIYNQLLILRKLYTGEEIYKRVITGQRKAYQKIIKLRRILHNGQKHDHRRRSTVMSAEAEACCLMYEYERIVKAFRTREMITDDDVKFLLELNRLQ